MSVRVDIIMTLSESDGHVIRSIQYNPLVIPFPYTPCEDSVAALDSEDIIY